MGLIIRQGVKHSIITLMATFVGMINVLFIYTKMLTETELGLFKYLLSIAQLVYPFLLLGFGSVAVRYFSIVNNRTKGNNGLLFLILFIPLLAFGVFTIGSVIFQEYIYGFYDTHEDKILLDKYLWYVIFIIFSMTFSALATGYISNFKRIVIPEILNNLWLKIAVPIFVVFFYWQYIVYENFLQLLVIAYLLSTIGMFVYLLSFKQINFLPNFKIYDKPLIKGISSYAGYSLLGGLGSVMATRIDSYMVGTLLNMETLGVYAVALFIATVIGIPAKSIFNITSPIIAEYLGSKQLGRVQELYNKTSLNLLIIGVLLLAGIWVSIDLLFEIIPNGNSYKAGKYVVLILGFSKLVDMSTGINTHIIGYSQFYRFSFYINLVLGVLNIIFNLVLIPLYGLVGVALATLSSMFIFNLLKCVFVFVKFKMHPFTMNMLYVLLLGAMAYVVALITPKTTNPFIDIIINSVIITIIYIPGVLYFNLSEDLTAFKQQFFEKIGLNK